jgi:C1A family cysteine protease
MCIIGYNDDKKCFIVRNSWGKDWGDKGNCYMPYDYFNPMNKLLIEILYFTLPKKTSVKSAFSKMKHNMET